jgi:FkbM family methyltransferase
MSVSINLIDEIANNHFQHSRLTEWWKRLNQKFTSDFSEEFSGTSGAVHLGSAGAVSIRNVDFGSISSAHLFGLDELIIFAWYELNSKNYKRTLDLGANIGVHSMLMSKFGFDVTAYEPDPHHAVLFNETMKENSVDRCKLRQKAIGTKEGKLNFTRVLGNTTGSHLTGAKEKPYGELQFFEVEVDSIGRVMEEKYDFVKMDVEGYEVELISALKPQDLNSTDIMLEIGTPENASEIFKELKRLDIRAFSQKKNWSEVKNVNDLPTSHREGSLFLTSSPAMNWLRS